MAEQSTDVVSLHVWPDTHLLAAEMVESGSDWLGHSERARLSTLRGRRRHEFLLGRVLLRAVLSFETGARPPGRWLLTERHELPPRLENNAEQLRFSLSHSGGHIVVAVGRFLDVGVDIERHKPRNYLALAEDWFHPNEIALISAANAGPLDEEFFRLWTLKEASLKSRCEGIFSGLTRKLDFSRCADITGEVDKAAICHVVSLVYRDASAAVSACTADQLKVFEWSGNLLNDMARCPPQLLPVSGDDYRVRWPAEIRS